MRARGMSFRALPVVLDGRFLLGCFCQTEDQISSCKEHPILLVCSTVYWPSVFSMDRVTKRLQILDTGLGFGFKRSEL